MLTLFFIVLWMVVGGFITPFVYKNKHRDPLTGMIVGALLGGLGGILILAPFWLLLPTLHKPCPNCASKVKVDSHYCPSCGYELTPKARAQSRKNTSSPMPDVRRSNPKENAFLEWVSGKTFRDRTYTLIDAATGRTIAALSDFQYRYLRRIALMSDSQNGSIHYFLKDVMDDDLANIRSAVDRRRAQRLSRQEDLIEELEQDSLFHQLDEQLQQSNQQSSGRDNLLAGMDYGMVDTPPTTSYSTQIRQDRVIQKQTRQIEALGTYMQEVIDLRRSLMNNFAGREAYEVHIRE